MALARVTGPCKIIKKYLYQFYRAKVLHVTMMAFCHSKMIFITAAREQ